jgi:hypothetical protein
MEEGLENVPLDSVQTAPCNSDLFLGVMYGSIQSATEGALEDLNLAESMLIQNLTRSEDKGRISLFTSD